MGEGPWRRRTEEEDRRRGGEEGAGVVEDSHSLLPTRGAVETSLLHVNFRESIRVKLVIIYPFFCIFMGVAFSLGYHLRCRPVRCGE